MKRELLSLLFRPSRRPAAVPRCMCVAWRKPRNHKVRCQATDSVEQRGLSNSSLARGEPPPSVENSTHVQRLVCRAAADAELGQRRGRRVEPVMAPNKNTATTAGRGPNQTNSPANTRDTIEAVRTDSSGRRVLRRVTNR